jgi:uncharacterized protein
MNVMYSRQTIAPWSQVAILLGVTGAGLILGGFAVIATIVGMTHLPMTEAINAIKDPKYVDAARMAQCIGALVSFGIPALIFAVIVGGRPFNYLGFNKNATAKQLTYVIIAMFTAIFVSAALGELNQLIPLGKSLMEKFKRMEDEYKDQVVAIATMKNNRDFILTLITIALIPAVVEELLFRSCVQPVMINLTRNAFIGILITSILFSAIHFSFYGFLARLFLGLLLGYIYYFSKNAWLNIFAHFFNNAIVVVQMYALSKAGKINTESMDDHFPWYIGIAGALTIIFVMTLFKRESDKTIDNGKLTIDNASDISL